MKEFLKILSKYLFLFIMGGLMYYGIEIIYRGYSHWSMFILGGFCFIGLGLINEKLPWQTPVWKQCLIGSGLITGLEFITGVLVNLVLGLAVWDYSALPLNILGQVCLPFSAIWALLALVGIVLDDWVRYWFFKEEKPHYNWKLK